MKIRTNIHRQAQVAVADRQDRPVAHAFYMLTSFDTSWG